MTQVVTLGDAGMMVQVLGRFFVSEKRQFRLLTKSYKAKFALSKYKMFAISILHTRSCWSIAFAIISFPLTVSELTVGKS